MGKVNRYKSTEARAKIIQAITERYYEPGNNQKCYKAVWKRYINPIYPMSYRTYLNYLNIPTDPPAPPQQLLPNLFGDLWD